MDGAQVRRIAAEALGHRGQDRAAFLDHACAGDEPLRRAVEATLSGAPDREASTDSESLTASAPIHEGPGSRIGPYKLLQQIGEGGFGSVFMAEQQTPVVRRVALKIIKLGMDTRQVIARFEAERQALAMMDHPNIAKVFDAGATDSGRPYFVMELVRGDPITDYCDSNNLSTDDRLGLFIQACRAVQHAHQKGIIHRDIKPSNILVTVADGQPIPKIIDFGIAKATVSRLTEKTLFTQHRAVIGTPEYMSPEQAEMSGVDIDTRSDIYSLGVLLYELLTGTTPIDAKALRSAAWGEMQRMIREDEPPRPSTRVSALATAPTPGAPESKKTTAAEIARHRAAEPGQLSRILRGDLDWIVMKCLDKNRTRRYDTASAVADDVQRHLAGEPVLAAPPSVGYRTRKFIRKHKGGVAIVGAGAGVLLLALAGTAYVAYRESAINQRERERNAREAKLQADAESSRANAERAIEATERANFLTYASHLTATQSLVASQNPAAARSRLEACDPIFRGWEWRYLWYAARSPLCILQGHTWNIRTIRFSADAKLIVTTSDDKTARVWDAVSGKQLSMPSQGLEFDSRLPPALGATDKGVALTNAELGPDGRVVAVSCADGTAHVCDWSAGKELFSVHAAGMSLYAAVFGPRGRFLVTWSEDGVAKVWDATTGQPVSTLAGHGRFFALTLTSDESRIAGLVSEGPEGRVVLRLWDTRSGAQSLAFENIPEKQDLAGCALSPDGTTVASIGGEALYVWDTTTGRLIHAFKNVGGQTQLEFSPDGASLRTYASRTVHQWNPLTGRETSHARLSYLVSVSYLDWNLAPAATQAVSYEASPIARVFDYTSPEQPAAVSQSPASLALALDPWGARVLCPLGGGDLAVVDSDEDIRIATLPAGSPRFSAGALSPDGAAAFDGSDTGGARLWNIGRQQLVAELPGHRAAITAAAFSRDSSRLATASADGALHVWNTAGKPLGDPEAHRARVNSLLFSPDGSRLLTASDDHTARLYPASGGAPILTLAHEQPVASATFTADGGSIVTACADGVARVWGSTTAAEPRFTVRTDGPLKGAVLVGNARLITLGADRMIRVWHLVSGRQLLEFPAFDAPVRSLALADAEGERLLVIATDGSARTFEAREPERRPDPRALRAAEFEPAAALVEQALAGPESLEDIGLALRTRTDISPLRRQLAAGLFEREAAKYDQEAAPLLASLQATCVTKPRVLAALDGAKTTSTRARERLNQLAREWKPNPVNVRQAAYDIALRPDAPPEQVAAALEAARELAAKLPETAADQLSILHTLRLIQYRSGDYQGALDTMTRSSALWRKTNNSEDPGDIAVTALIDRRLARHAEADRGLAKLRELVNQGGDNASTNMLAFLKEAESMVPGAPTPTPPQPPK